MRFFSSALLKNLHKAYSGEFYHHHKIKVIFSSLVKYLIDTQC
tara:strand:+ start:519 stop:647 length:129 start_codon:yes stop_codon:yes gene_type:complete